MPSGTLWATEVIKDTNGNNLYFAWGETSGYTEEQVGTVKNFSWGDDKYENDYKFGPFNVADETNYGMTRYNNNDNLSALTITNEPPINEIDDAAVVKWGNGWRMPTKAEFEELMSGTTSAWTVSDNGISGVTFTSTKNGNTLFFPAVGVARDSEVGEFGYYGNYWSASLYDDGVANAWFLEFDDMTYRAYHNYRYYGHSVRPVRSNN